MKNILILIALLTAGLVGFSGAMASDEAGEAADKQAPSSEEVVAMCEDKFNSDKYSDENERNNLIDACINESTEKMAPRAEEG